MPTSREQKIKLLVLHDLLTRYTDEEHSLSTRQIVEMLKTHYGVTVGSRALLEDIRLLNDFGYEVCTVKQKSYYFYVVDRTFDTPELKMLIDAVQAAGFISDSHTERFIAKIAELAGIHRAELLKKSYVSFDTVKSANKHIFYSIDALVSAMEQKKKASFLYYDFNLDKNRVFRKDGARYVVNPLALIYTNDKYYLVCYSDKYRALANYRIDRMEKVEVESDDLVPVSGYENFDMHAFKRQAFSMFTGELKDVTLTVDNSCIDAILDKFGEQVPLIRVDEKSFSVTAKVQVSPPFFAWCLTSCGKIRIAKPVEVVQGYEEYVRAVLPDKGV